MSLLRKLFKHKNIGWKEIHEEFTRYALLKTKWFNVYLHELSAPEWHHQCHDHPWSFVTLILKRGYLEQIGDKFYWRSTGNVLYRPAEFSHNVITPFGKAWSLVITGPTVRKWGHLLCRAE